MDQHNGRQFEITCLMYIFCLFLKFGLILFIVKLLSWNKTPPIVHTHDKVDVKDDKNTYVNVIPEFFEVVIIVILILVVLLICKVNACE